MSGPLSNIRVADFGWIWAGAWAGQYLGYLGADIVHIESRLHPDLVRGLQPFADNEMGLERSGYFAIANRGKRSITLALANPDGQNLAREIIKRSDVVTENFSPGTMAKYGLDYESLKKINPGIIMVSVSGFGASGPESQYVAFGPGIISHSGLTSVTGYAPDRPVPLGTSYPDPTAGFYGVIAVLSALRHRTKTGEGQYVDVALQEVTLATIGDEFMEYSLNRRQALPRGNRHRAAAPHGNYRCSGEDDWVSIVVATEEEWRGFLAALGDPAWGSDPKFSDGFQRYRNQDELDRLITEWTKGRPSQGVADLLHEHGVAAAPCYKSDELMGHPHLRARNAFVGLPHPEIGVREQTNIPVRMSRTPVAFARPQPLLGQHTDEILSEVLGLSAEEIQRHREAGALE